MWIERHPDAEKELEEAAKFYDSRLLGLGRDFVLEVRNTLALIEQFPLASSKISPNIRKFAVKRFPFNVLYALDDEVIFIVAIMHHRRKPGYWKTRLG
jgi:toxin ParE1/3/4